MGLLLLSLVGCTTQEEKMQIWRNKRAIEELQKEVAELKVRIEKLAPESEEEKLNQRIKRLIDALGSDDFLDRYEAGKELKKIGKPAVPYLIKALRDKRAKVRMGAIFVLGEIKDKNAVPEIIKAFKDAKNKKDKAGLALLLGKLGDKRATDVLIEGLNDSSATVTASCITALGMLKEEKAIPQIADFLTHRNKHLRETARKALVRIGKRGLPQLEKVLASSNERERLEVIKVLERIEGSDYLLEKTLNDSNKYVKIYSAYVLSKRGNEKGKMIARNFLKDPDSKVRALAKEILSKQQINGGEK